MIFLKWTGTLVLVLLGGVGLSLWAQVNKNQLDEASIQVEKLFIEANRDKILGKTEEAIAGFELVLKEDAENAAANYELARLYRQQKKLNKALLYAEQSKLLAPYNRTFNDVYVSLLDGDGQYKRAAETYALLLEKYPDDEDLYIDCAYFNSKNGKPALAIQLYNNLEKRQGIQATTSLRKFKMYKRMNKGKKAIFELEKLMEAFPFEANYVLKLANYYVATAEQDKAKVYFQKTLDIEPTNSEANLAMIDFFLQNGDTSSYLNALLAIFENPKQGFKSKIKSLESLVITLTEGQLNPYIVSIQNLSQKLVQIYPQNGQANILNGEVYFYDKKYAKALEYFKVALNSQQNNLQLWKRTLECQRLTNNKAELVKYATTLIDLYPGQACSHYYKGIAWLYQTNYIKAVEALKLSKDLAFDDKDLTAASWRYLAWAYHRMHQSENTQKAFAASFDLLADNEETIYFYALTSIENKKDIDKSLQLVKGVIAKQPDNIQIRTIHGRLLYQQGAFKLAEQTWQYALQIGGSAQPDLIEYYGNALFQLGQKEKALEYWQEALKKGSRSSVLPQKIATKQLYE